jgi:hypothetical protein
VLDSGIEQSSSIHKLSLENIIKLYLPVRAFSYARDYISKYKIKEKQTKRNEAKVNKQSFVNMQKCYFNVHFFELLGIFCAIFMWYYCHFRLSCIQHDTLSLFTKQLKNYKYFSAWHHHIVPPTPILKGRGKIFLEKNELGDNIFV